MSDAVEDAVRDFLESHIEVASLGADDDIFELGLTSSLFVIQLVAFIEDMFKVIIEADDLQIPMLCSINRITELVERYSATAPIGGF